MSICGGTTRYRRHTLTCPVCGIAKSEIVESIPGSAYWPPTCACTNCGDRWSDGELLERPFRPGWRQESITRAVAAWEAGCRCPVKFDDDLMVLPCEHGGDR